MKPSGCRIDYHIWVLVLKSISLSKMASSIETGTNRGHFRFGDKSAEAPAGIVMAFWSSPPSDTTAATVAGTGLFPITPSPCRSSARPSSPAGQGRCPGCPLPGELLLTHHATQALGAGGQPTRAVTPGLPSPAVIDERTGLTNRLIALLEAYFPQALRLCGEDLWRPLATASAQMAQPAAARKAKTATLKTFYHLQGSRSATLLTERLALLEKAVR